LRHVVDDFGETAGHTVDIAETPFADPARRWAVILDGGGLVFVEAPRRLSRMTTTQVRWWHS
jgi:hypothetical protein